LMMKWGSMTLRTPRRGWSVIMIIPPPLLMISRVLFWRPGFCIWGIETPNLSVMRVLMIVQLVCMWSCPWCCDMLLCIKTIW
jgi:hypothetical protein